MKGKVKTPSIDQAVELLARGYVAPFQGTKTYKPWAKQFTRLLPLEHLVFILSDPQPSLPWLQVRAVQMSNGNGMKHNPSFSCQDPGCKRSFSRARDLTRHSVVHDESSPKRRCPYPDSQCRLGTDEKHQLSNWYEHLVTVHSRYQYRCEMCKQRFKQRKDLYPHEEVTGHMCTPGKWSDTWRESELAEKDCCYRETRAELLQMREQGVNNAWDNSWPETLPEYTNFMNGKQRQPSSRNRRHASLSGNLSQSSSMQIPSNVSLSESDDYRRLRRKQRRHQPYFPHAGPSTSSKAPTAGPSHEGAKDNSEVFSHHGYLATASHTTTSLGDVHINNNLALPEGTSITLPPSESVPPFLGDPDAFPNSDHIMTQAEFQQLWDLLLPEGAPAPP